VTGTVAYVAGSYSGLQVIDVSDPASPAILGSVFTPGFALGVAVSGTMAYVAYAGDYDSGLQVIDVSDPASPAILGSVFTPYPSGVAVSGTVAYVADYLAGLLAIDVSDPGSPVILGSVNTPGFALGVAVFGTVAYVAVEYSDLQVIDVSNPASPAILGSVSPPAYARRVAVSGTVVCLASGDAGLMILPPQCAITPVLLSSFTASPRPQGILLEWATSSETNFSGFHVHRSLSSASDYQRLTLELIRPGAAYRFLDREVSPGITYYYRLEALDRTGNRESFGPVSARIEPGGVMGLQPTLGQAFPNPVQRGPSTIPFTLSQAGNVKVRILDLAGREVRRLLDKVMEAGDQSTQWDGLSERGEALPAGIYLYHLQTAGFEATRKLVRLQ
jgi:hypothetical protein